MNQKRFLEGINKIDVVFSLEKMLKLTQREVSRIWMLMVSQTEMGNWEEEFFFFFFEEKIMTSVLGAGK